MGQPHDCCYLLLLFRICFQRLCVSFILWFTERDLVDGLSDDIILGDGISGRSWTSWVERGIMLWQAITDYGMTVWWIHCMERQVCGCGIPFLVSRGSHRRKFRWTRYMTVCLPHLTPENRIPASQHAPFIILLVEVDGSERWPVIYYVGIDPEENGRSLYLLKESWIMRRR